MGGIRTKRRLKKNGTKEKKKAQMEVAERCRKALAQKEALTHRKKKQ